ncbi:MAG: sugar transferase [Patescibacteria group bacterium]|nr:sugar transferase [Patescibacteria group bacterium]MDP4030914.1 sugar transferase [Candidatus Beckwithbacteria bacterium]MDZ4228878.1 sugar transferase [Patescibacteria group bacterium]
MYRYLKRTIDIVLSLFLALLFFPIWIIIPLIIWLDSGWPVIYSHRRVGQNGRNFRLYKFRTMIKDADRVLYQKDKRLLKKFKAGDWKLAADPRITKLGRFLRNLTIDEFPQIYNVVYGDMSLVGPRAYIPRELVDQTKKYPRTKPWMPTILTVKPGITGPWQTSGRNVIPFDKRAGMDLNYAKHYNFWWDLLIILKTPQAMLSKW